MSEKQHRFCEFRVQGLSSKADVDAIRAMVHVANGGRGHANKMLRDANVSGVERYLGGSALTTLREWLVRIVEARHDKKKGALKIVAIRQEIKEQLERSVRARAARFGFRDDGLMDLQVEIEIRGVMSLCAYGVAILVSREGEGQLAKGLVYCRYCGRFRFFERDGSSRRPKDYCSYEHKNAYGSQVKRGRAKTPLPERPQKIRVDFTNVKLIKTVKDPTLNEQQSGAALKELARRGIDVRTGKQVGRAKATKIASRYADMAAS